MLGRVGLKLDLQQDQKFAEVGVVLGHVHGGLLDEGEISHKMDSI